MSKSRLVSGKVKKLVGSELDSDRSSFLNLANAEPDLGLPTVDESILVGDTDGTRTWIDITTYAEEFKGYTGSQGVIGFTGSRGDVGFTGSFGFTGSRGDVGYTGSQGVIGFILDHKALLDLLAVRVILGLLDHKALLDLLAVRVILGLLAVEGISALLVRKGRREILAVLLLTIHLILKLAMLILVQVNCDSTMQQ